LIAPPPSPPPPATTPHHTAHDRCTADCGWITGHTFLAYGPLLRGATAVIFGSTPAHPDPGRCWRIVEKYRVRALLLGCSCTGLVLGWCGLGWVALGPLRVDVVTLV